MASKEQTKGNTGADPEVDRIRDIIFGPQMRDYDQRFRVFQDDLDRLQRALDRLGEVQSEHEASFAKKLQALRAELRQDDDGLRAELRKAVEKLTDDKVDRINLGDLLIQLGTQLKRGNDDGDLLAGLSHLVSGQESGAGAKR
jgi:hypothetical protein